MLKNTNAEPRQQMFIEEVIGRAVTNIYSLVKLEIGGLDTGECFIELDNEIITEIPFGGGQDIYIKEIDKDAVSLFADLSDYPVYHVNKGKKSIAEILDKRERDSRGIFNKLRIFLFGQNIAVKEYQPYKVEYREQKIKHIKDKKILDFLWYPEDSGKGFILFENGFLISETIIANHGTGLAGLNLYESIDDLVNAKGNNFLKLSDRKRTRL